MLTLGRIVIFFLCLATGGFCCNNGWYSFEGKCYTVSEDKYSNDMSKKICEVLKAHLAIVHSPELLHFLNTVSDFNGTDEYWVDGSSSLPQAEQNSSARCPYIKEFKINRGYCGEKKFVLCESSLPDTPSDCPPGFDFYGTKCFKAVSSKTATYEDAQKFCRMYNSTLATLDARGEEEEAEAATLAKNGVFLVGARKTDGVVKWDNGVPVNNWVHFSIQAFTDHENKDGECVGLLHDPEKTAMFVWVLLKCDDKHNFLCEAGEPTLPPLECPHGRNWKSHDISGDCFLETASIDVFSNWFQARSICKLYGGDLASFESSEQEKMALGGANAHYKGFWIGLQRDVNSDVFHWVDGSVMNYTNWATGEPDLNSSSKFCVAHSPLTSEWALDYCGVRRKFVCKVPKVRNPFVPKLPSPENTRCDVSSLPVYSSDWHPSHWHEFEEHCYLIMEEMRYTWDTARYFCQDNGAHMASIHSFDETNFLLGSIYPGMDYWIGLSADGLVRNEWTDNTPLDFIYWTDNKTEPKDINVCVHFNRRDGAWDFDNCNRIRGVICKRGINATYDFTSPEPTTVMPGNCENGWYNLGNKCYHIFGKLWSQRVTWAQAKLECEAVGATLVSIHNRDEQDFLTDVVLEARTDVWIGLVIERGSSYPPLSIFSWSDDSRMDFTNWDVDQPNHLSETRDIAFRSAELCIQMEHGENRTGKWNDISGDEKRAFVCQKYKDPTHVGPYVDPFDCGSEWYRLGSACIGVFEQEDSTWLEAQAECAKHDADLMTFTGMAESVFLKGKLKRKQAHYWIGVREKMPDKYECVTGHRMFYTNWMSGQPRAASKLLDNCVAVTADGSWLVKSCKDKNPFVCKLRTDKDPDPEIDSTHTCNNLTGDWDDFGLDYCYLYQAGLRLSWVDAKDFCFQQGGYLASFHSREEIDRIRKIILWYKTYSVHIGLGRKKDGGYAWVDNSTVDFVNWGKDKPSDSHWECAALNVRSSYWYDVHCDDRMEFVCSSPKNKDPDPEIDSTHTCNNLTDDWNDFGGDYCYLYQEGRRLWWTDATLYCFWHGGYLASFHSPDEIDRVRKIALGSKTKPSVYIGLRRKKDGGYAWIDNSPVDFVNWGKDEPSDRDSECVEMSLTNGKWYAVHCDEWRMEFVCSSPKMSVYFEDASSEKETVSQKLTAGGIFGIVISFLVILTIIGATWYYLRRKKQIQPNLEENDDL